MFTVAMMLFGTFCLGPWLNGMAAIAATDPMGVLQNTTFLDNRQLLSLTVGPMMLAMLFLVFISVIKPWKRVRQE
ncbi:MAG: hypothetical protein WCG26_08325 [Chloroflexales bacterium]